MSRTGWMKVAAIGSAALIFSVASLAPCAAADATGDDFMLMAPEVFENTVDFLMSLDLALFAMVGYFAKDGFVTKSSSLRCSQELLLIVFLGFGVMSLVFAYWSRLELMEQLAGRTFIYEDLESYSKQAWTLLIAAVAAGAFVFIHFLDKRLNSSGGTA